MQPKIKRLPLLIGLVLVLCACNLPADLPEPGIPAEVVYTQAAETIVAQLTQIVLPPTPTSQLVQPTATAEIPQPGATQTDVPTSTPTITLTPEPSVTPELIATMTPASSDPRDLLGEPDWSDTFRNDSNWSEYEDENVRFRIGENRMLMAALQANFRDNWIISWPTLDDIYLELTATSDDCAGLDRYGLIFRTDAEEGYLFGVSCDGRYSLRAWDGTEFSELVDWTSSQAILSGANQTNRLGVRAVGEKITLFVNGARLADVEDTSFDEGSFGVFIGAAETEGFQVQASEVAYWTLP